MNAGSAFCAFSLFSLIEFHRTSVTKYEIPCFASFAIKQLMNLIKYYEFYLLIKSGQAKA